jgi:UDP-N-acetylglucosamine 2-epimerase (non-hydrolysing)
MTRSRLALVTPSDDTHAARRWLAVPGEQAPYRLLHVVADVDDVYRVAPVAAALDGAGEFEHIAVDATPGHRVAAALSDFGTTTSISRLDVAGRSGPRRLGALLDGFERLIGDDEPTAAIVYADDDPSLACTLSAARRSVPVIQVVPGGADAGPPSRTGALINRLADLLLVADEKQAERLVRRHVPRHRIHVVGDPLMDVLRRYARRADAIELCHRHGVEPGNYAWVALRERMPASLSVSLRLLAAQLPLLVEVTAATERDDLDHAEVRFVEPAGHATRLCLERAAGAIVTDSRRVAERAAMLGIPHRLVADRELRAADDPALDLSGLRGRRRPRGFDPDPARDAGPPARLADAIIANFARVVVGTA